MERLGVRTAFCALVAFAFVALAGSSVLAAPQEHVLYEFTGGTDGGGPMGRLALNMSSGNFYGTTHFGGIVTCGGQIGGGCGVVFQLSHLGSRWTETPIFAFADGPDGGFPNAGVIFDPFGNLWGSASTGGNPACSLGCGVVYQLIDNSGVWSEAILHAFDGTDGQFPNSDLTIGNSDNTYGTTWYGGAHGAGVVFRIRSVFSGFVFNDLYSFNGTQDGSSPAGGVVEANGDLFGTTYPYNGYNDGVVFKLRERDFVPFKYHLIEAFGRGDGRAGENPYAGLTVDAAGDLYGTTIEGGNSGSGVVFELLPNGGHFRKRVLHTFTGSPDGSSPYAGLTIDAAGNLYGSTVFGGTYNYGTVFELHPDQRGNYKERILYNFTGSGDGANPKAAPILDSSGNLYGTTEGGGQYGEGVAYEITQKD